MNHFSILLEAGHTIGSKIFIFPFALFYLPIFFLLSISYPGPPLLQQFRTAGKNNKPEHKKLDWNMRKSISCIKTGIIKRRRQPLLEIFPSLIPKLFNLMVLHNWVFYQ